MSNFDSPLGKKSFNTQALREFDVPDASDQYGDAPQGRPIHRIQRGMPDDSAIAEFQNRLQQTELRDPAEIEQEIRAAKEARRVGVERITDGAKRRVEMLLGMTRHTKDIDVKGNVFTFQVLKGKEMRAAILAASKYDGTVEGPFEMRKQYLARSITHVAGVEIGNFLSSNSLETKLAFIDELDEPLLNHLYDGYVQLAKEAREMYGIKDENDAKEVMEDLKKS